MHTSKDTLAQYGHVNNDDIHTPVKGIRNEQLVKLISELKPLNKKSLTDTKNILDELTLLANKYNTNSVEEIVLTQDLVDTLSTYLTQEKDRVLKCKNWIDTFMHNLTTE